MFGHLTVGIDASRNRSGGAIAHLKGILSAGDPEKFGISRVHVWSYRSLLDDLPCRPWLVKHSPIELERSLMMQLYWQRFRLPSEFQRAGCDVLLNTDAGTVSTVRPCVTMSRDMLSYEPGVAVLFGLSKARLRITLLRYMQNRSLRRADGVIFLTRYAARVIQQSCGRLKSVAYIPHGVGSAFKECSTRTSWPKSGASLIRCLYVSNTELYKNQWVVVSAVELLRQRGHNVTLSLVGGGKGRAQDLLQSAIATVDPNRVFVEQLEFLPQHELPRHFAEADLFIFASSCENMPNTLIEAMAAGLPIACSDRGPMPEVLANGGVYFDPTDAESIAAAVEQIIQDSEVRLTISELAKGLAEQYSWRRCADETWAFVSETVKKTQI